MPANSYNWVPDELVDVADEIGRWLKERGYSLKVEKSEPGFPFPPTFLATRGKLERIVVEILPSWQDDRIKTWIAYARTCSKELKLCVGIAQDLVLPALTVTKVREMGVGILRSGNGGTFFELEPADASINVSLPPRGALHQETKSILGSAYDHFEASRWRDGFEEACKAFERSAKRYLKKWVKTGRVRFVTRSGMVAYTNRKIDRMTMGGLEAAFETIQAQNSSDKVILKALKAIRADRNKLTHDKWNMKTEKRLRGNVGQHMWIITQALVETYK